MQVDELYRQFIDKKKNPPLLTTMQTMLLEGLTAITKRDDELLRAYAGTLLYVFHDNDDFPNRLPITMPANLTIKNRLACSIAALQMSSRIGQLEKELIKLAGDKPTTGLAWQIKHHKQLREGLGGIALFLDPAAGAPKVEGKAI